MRRISALVPTILSLAFLPLLNAAELTGVWKADGTNTPHSSPEAPGEAAVTVRFPGSAQLYREPDRATFRPSREAFEAAEFELEARVITDTPDPVRAWLFFKDKDGRWYQTIEEYRLTPGVWQKLSARLDRTGAVWRGVGHTATFDAMAATEFYAGGISVYGEEKREFTLEVRNAARTGKREPGKLALLDCHFPEQGEANALFQGRFRLLREFFNPFDPDEVTVDFEIKAPNGKLTRLPAFYSRDYERRLHHTRETATPIGQGFWEFRFTPPVPGEYRLRAVIADKTARETVTGSWKSFTALPSRRPGLVRASEKDPFFELGTGEFFFPVGLNIHTNTDRRSEFGFKFGRLPDRGTFDYDDYLEACGRGGINAVEIWMAGWTYAIEHDATRAGNYGVGRYNLEAAWKLDHIFEQARKNGIYLNLILDNHGRLSDRSDPEWQDNPINSTTPYAKANGGFLANPADFFRSEAAEKNDRKRARYIAARWGNAPNLMAVDLWSEVDLTEDYWGRYNDGSAIRWAEKAAAFLQANSRPDLPVSIHFCSDYNNVRRFIKLFDNPSITHLAGDAYRSPQIHFVDHLRGYEQNMRYNKPQLITEFGGNPQGSSERQVLADIHSGLWSSLFVRLAGTPFLWWHDFVHLRNHYQHYLGFSRYLAGIDLRGKERVYFTPAVAVPANQQKYESLGLSLPAAAYGWIYNRNAMLEYPDDPNQFPETRPGSVTLAGHNLTGGVYLLRWFVPLTGECLPGELKLNVEAGKPVTFALPPFRLDLAFKLEKTEAE